MHVEATRRQAARDVIGRVGNGGRVLESLRLADALLPLRSPQLLTLCSQVIRDADLEEVRSA